MLNPGYNAGEGSSRLVELLDGNETIGLATEDPAQLSAPSAPKRCALPPDWEQHKEKIRELYLDDNKPLREVMAIMKRDYQHFGSPKQYKNKLRDWKYDTKYKRHQTVRKRKCQRPKHQSAGADHPLTSRADVHHSQVPDARTAGGHLSQPTNAETSGAHIFEAPEARGALDHLVQPADAGCADYQGFQSAGAGYPVDHVPQAFDTRDSEARLPQTPNTESVGTADNMHQPSADNEENWQLSIHRRRSLALSHAVGVRSGRSATPPISIAERIFALAQRHVETSFTYGIWKVDSGNVCVSMTCTKEEMDLPESYFDLMRSAVLLFEQGSTDEFGHVVRKAFALVKPILRTANVRALNFFWTSLVFLIQFGHAGIAVLLIKHIYEMTMILFHPGHPVVQMFELLTQIDALELESLVHRTWQTTADAFQEQLPKLHPEYVRHQCDLIFRIYGTTDADTAERRLREIHKECESTAQTPVLSRLTALNALGYNFMNSKDWVQAVNIGLKLEESARLEQDIDLLVYQIGGMEIQARAFNEMKLIMPAIRCLKQATPLIAKQWGNNDPWRIELMVLQQNWLRENGEIKAADDLKAEISSLTKKFDKE